MKRFFCLLALAGLLLSLGSCRGTAYSNRFTAPELGEQLLNALQAANGYLRAESDVLADYFEIPDFVTDHAVYFRSNRNSLDEFGIFRTEDGRAKEIAALLSDYLSRSLEQNRAWYDSYIPAETPKLRDAEVRTFGNYAVYAILSDEDRASLFEEVEALLTLKP